MGAPVSVATDRASVPSGSMGNVQARTKPTVFRDDFDEADPKVWERSDGWSNEKMFNCGWRAENVTFVKDGTNQVMSITLNDIPSSGKPYSSGEYRTRAHFGYGFLEARMKAAKGNGTISSVFLCTGPWDEIGGKKNPWDEIDIEILGNDTTKMQVNYITDSEGSKGGHEKLIKLGFDASEDFHTYAIRWEKERIIWSVDGKAVHVEDGERGALPTYPGRIMMNLWPGIGVEGWCGRFEYKSPLKANYDWVKFTPIENQDTEKSDTKVK